MQGGVLGTVLQTPLRVRSLFANLISVQFCAKFRSIRTRVRVLNKGSVEEERGGLGCPHERAALAGGLVMTASDERCAESGAGKFASVLFLRALSYPGSAGLLRIGRVPADV